ncbi:hypothetical protein Y032_0002g553 [Ancylostoma ceylanicum]|uniref:Uncharacterized protein n=1 Tax=Ancylostoma ceylanicum TaxID=53326 RepID=A0A016W0B0_9BILA|nr:hypothetical protein Y032_0002g553 [Ancylostoma ceylanicum]
MGTSDDITPRFIPISTLEMLSRRVIVSSTITDESIISECTKGVVQMHDLAWERPGVVMPKNPRQGSKRELPSVTSCSDGTGQIEIMAQKPAQQNLSESPLKQIATKYFLSCTAALVAETVTYPLDITKTRLQIARNQHTKGGMFQVTYDIVRKEGPLSLWSGVGPAITRHYIYTGIRMGGYETLRGMVFDEEREKSFPVWKSMLCGATAGLVAQFAASPTDLIKSSGANANGGTS